MMCVHLEQTVGAHPSARTDGCEACLAMGGRWVHLRQCLECGRVGCCDASTHRHATAHYRLTGHPVVRSLEPGETWRWCYADGQRAEV